MSSSDNKWELGVVAAYEPFEDFDRYGQLGAAHAAIDADLNEAVDDSSGVILTMNSSQASDWAEDPFYLFGTLSTTVPGAEIILGPSTDSSWEGAVEWATVSSVSGTSVTLLRSDDFTHIAYPFSAYGNGDQVLIRTVPLNWSTASDFSAAAFGVGPAKRYQERESLVQIAAGGATYADHTNYEYRHGVRLWTNDATEDTDRYIERYFDVNSFNPRIRRWRIGYDYRIVRASSDSALSAPASGDVKITAGLATANNDLLYKIDFTPNPDETGNVDAGNDFTDQLKAYTHSDQTDTWTSESFLASGFGSTDTDNDWDFLASSDDPENSGFNRGNKWYLKIAQEHGTNMAFEMDNLLIEHAHGTSDEALGFYTIDDFCDQGSLEWEMVERTSGFQRLKNGALKVNHTTDLRPRYRFTCDFTNVNTEIYRDLIALTEWQKRGHRISIRPFSSVLPSVMVGYLDVNAFDTRNWDLGRVSFNMQFEES